MFPVHPLEEHWIIPSVFCPWLFLPCVYVFVCVMCVMPLVRLYICPFSFSITSLAFTLAVGTVWLQSLVGKCVCLCWTMSGTLAGHLTSTLGSDWTCHPAEGHQVTWWTLWVAQRLVQHFLSIEVKSEGYFTVAPLFPYKEAFLHAVYTMLMDVYEELDVIQNLYINHVW